MTDGRNKELIKWQIDKMKWTDSEMTRQWIQLVDKMAGWWND